MSTPFDPAFRASIDNHSVAKLKDLVELYESCLEESKTDFAREHFAGRVADVKSVLEEKQEAKRMAQRRRARQNRKAREEALKSLGLTKTPYGWE
jgi:hypothetical protein